MTVEIASNVEGEVGGHTHAHGSHDRVQHIPVVVQEPFMAGLNETVVGVATGRRPLWLVGDKGSALLQTGQHAGHARSSFQAAVEGFDEVLLAHPLGRRGEDRDRVLLRHPPYPGLVGVGALLDARV